MVPPAAISFTAMSTMETAPSTIFLRAAMTASACWRAQHRLGDLGGVGKMGEAGRRRHPRRRVPRAHRELAAQGFGDLFHIGAQRDGAGGIGLVLKMVVGVHARHVAQRRLGLHGDIALVVVDVEERLGGIGDVPHHDGCDLDGVAPILSLTFRRSPFRVRTRVEIVVGLPLAAFCAAALAALESLISSSIISPIPADPPMLLLKNGLAQKKPLVADGAHVLAEQDAHARLAGLQREEIR